MIVPSYWAEGRIQQRVGSRQITVRRFGWSDDSVTAAQAHADERTRTAFDRVAAGAALPRREPKQAYNGADGVPIREEVLAREGDCVITRNGYGARCLNTPDVLFADIDFVGPARAPMPQAMKQALLPALLAGFTAAWMLNAWMWGLAMALITWGVATWLHSQGQGRKAAPEVTPETQAWSRLDAFLAQHPDWHLRVYRTPAGLRVLVMHQRFAPSDAAVSECFEALGVDPVYARMCRAQNCFRARLSPKPWRVGIGERLRPRPGVWPVAPVHLPRRAEWVRRYELAAQGHAACSFVAALGAVQHIDAQAQAVQCLHDELSRSGSGLPIA